MKKIILALLSGILLVLSWPEIGNQFYLIFVAFVPLFFIENEITTSKCKKPYWTFFLYVFISFLIWNVGTTWWVFNASSYGSLGAFILNSLFASIVFSLFILFKKQLGGFRSVIALISIFVGWEYFHFNWDLSWPWLTIGNVFANQTWLVQWYEYTGILGGSIWVLLINYVLYTSIKQYVLSKQININYFILIILLLPVALSLKLYYSESEFSNKIIKTAIVQPNIDPYNQKFGAEGTALLNDAIYEALKKTGQDSVFVLLPETALQEYNYLKNINDSVHLFGLWENNIEQSQSFISLNKHLDNFPNITFVGGASTDKIVGEKLKNSVATRSIENSNLLYQSYNTAFYKNEKDSVQLYHKSKLVVGVELFPFKSLLDPLIGEVTEDLGGTTGTLGVQYERTPFNIKGTAYKIAPIICYESIYGEFLGGFVENGANVIFIITNDGWWGDSPGYKQHLAYARLRAIETRRYIARCANTGQSAYIDDKGDIIKKTAYWKKDLIEQELPLLTEKTFYVINGDYLGRLGLFVGLLLFLYSLTKSIKNKEV